MARRILFRKPEDPGEIAVVVPRFRKRRQSREINRKEARKNNDGELRRLIDPEPENEERNEGERRNDPQRLERERKKVEEPLGPRNQKRERERNRSRNQKARKDPQHGGCRVVKELPGSEERHKALRHGSRSREQKRRNASGFGNSPPEEQKQDGKRKREKLLGHQRREKEKQKKMRKRAPAAYVRRPFAILGLNVPQLHSSGEEDHVHDEKGGE